jgi:anti-sigma B factor antagonist
MELNVLEKENVIIIQMSGKIVGGPDSAEINKQVTKAIEEKKVNVIIDLSGVELMNSSGLGILIQSNQLLKQAGGKLKLASVTEKIQSLFVITKLNTVFDTYDSVDKAIESYN